MELLEWKTGCVEENQNKIGPLVNFVLLREATSNELILTRASGRKKSYILHFTEEACRAQVADHEHVTVGQKCIQTV